MWFIFTLIIVQFLTINATTCRSDICKDDGNDCCTTEDEPRGCQIEGYKVMPGDTTTFPLCVQFLGKDAVYQCCLEEVAMEQEPSEGNTVLGGENDVIASDDNIVLGTKNSVQGKMLATSTYIRTRYYGSAATSLPSLLHVGQSGSAIAGPELGVTGGISSEYGSIAGSVQAAPSVSNSIATTPSSASIATTTHNTSQDTFSEYNDDYSIAGAEAPTSGFDGS